MERRQILVLLSTVALLFNLLMVGWAATGCHQCTKGTMRCNGTQVQLCAPNHRWKTVVDCSRLKRTKKQYGCVVLSNKRCSCRVEEKKP